MKDVWLTFCALAACAASAAESPLLVGAAENDITPPLGTLVVGGFEPKPATDVLDPLKARAVVIASGATTIGFVVCDNFGFPRYMCDEAKRRIHRDVGIPPANMLIACTHTHSAGSARTQVGPDTETPSDKLLPPGALNSYQEFIVSRIVDAVSRAQQQMREAAAASGESTLSGFVFNRRWFVESVEARRNPYGGVDQVRMIPSASHGLIRPAGPVDPAVPMLAFSDTNGKPIAVIGNYAMHSVAGLPPGVVSADYFGRFCDRLKEMLTQPDAVMVMTNGASADINSTNYSLPRTKIPPGERMSELGNRIADEVAQVHRDAKFDPSPVVRISYRDVRVKRNRPNKFLADRSAKLLTTGEGRGWHPREEHYARRILEYYEGPEYEVIPLQVIRVGQLGMFAIPAEVFVEIGLELRARSPFPHNMIIEIANGCFGYLPTPEQHKVGGFETWFGTSQLESGASTLIVETLIQQAKELSH